MSVVILVFLVFLLAGELLLLRKMPREPRQVTDEEIREHWETIARRGA